MRDLPVDRLNQLEQTVQVSISSTSEEVRDVDRGVHHGTRPILVSISSTSEEVRDLKDILNLQDKDWVLVSISSTSEEVRDRLSIESLNYSDRLFPLVPLPKKCVTLGRHGAFTIRTDTCSRFH